MKKKVFCVLLALTMLLSGCSSGAEQKPTPGASAEPTQKATSSPIPETPDKVTDEPTDEPTDGLTVIDSGECGENVTWTLYTNGTLIISGSGPMEDYNWEDGNMPWSEGRRIITMVVIENGVTSIGDAAFCDLSNVISVIIPNNITSIGAYAFRNCYSLTSVTIPDSVISIGDAAFVNCDSLTGVTIPNSVTSIGIGTFANCFSLTSIDAASGNAQYTSIDGVLFSADQTLLHTYPAGKNGNSYSIPSSVTIIEADAFFDCGSLTSVTIPDSVTIIRRGAFLACSNLTDVYYSGSEAQWNQITIDNDGVLGGSNTPLLSAVVHYNS